MMQHIRLNAAPEYMALGRQLRRAALEALPLLSKCVARFQRNGDRITLGLHIAQRLFCLLQRRITRVPLALCLVRVRYDAVSGGCG